MFSRVVKAIKTQTPIVLLLQGEGGQIVKQKIRPIHIEGTCLIGYSLSEGKDRKFNLDKLLGLHHWFED